MIPDWIPQEAWAGFVAMRKHIKKPMTPRAEQLIVNALQKFRDAGQDVGAVLDQSVMNSWQGVFEVRGRSTEQRQDQRAVYPSLGKFGQLTANHAQDWLEGA